MSKEFTHQLQTVVDNIRRVVVAGPDVVKMSILGLPTSSVGFAGIFCTSGY